jgi:tRNA A37 N6-isopentenylltransferase MiaA
VKSESTLEQAVAGTQIATRQYAKRQRTWFQREPGIVWLRDFGDLPETFETAKSHVKNFLNIS